MIIVFRVGTPYPFLSENLTQQCMVAEVQNGTNLFYQKLRQYWCHLIQCIPLNSVTPRPEMIANIIIILFKRSLCNLQLKIHKDCVLGEFY